jgi:hypothetical protein
MTTESTLLTAGTENTVTATTSTAEATTTTGTTAVAETTATQPTGTETKVEGEGKTTEAEGKPGEGEKAPDGAPEKYADFKAPEGATLAPELVSEVSTLAKELNLSQDKAQKVIDTAVKLAQQNAAQSQQQITDTIKATQAQWATDAKADKELGGEKLAENLARAKSAMEVSASPALQELLGKSGLGNHPEVIRHFLKLAPVFLEGKHVPGGKALGNDGKSPEKVLYPNLK